MIKNTLNTEGFIKTISKSPCSSKKTQHDYSSVFATVLQDHMGAKDSVIHAALFNHTKNENL